MLLSQQPLGCTSSIPALPQSAINHCNSTKFFNSILTPPTVTIRIEASFTSKQDMWPIEYDPNSTSPLQRPKRAGSGNQISSPELRTSRCANAELQKESKYESVRRNDEDEDDFGMVRRPENSKVNSTKRPARSSNDEVDIFEVQRHTQSTQSTPERDQDKLARQLGSTDLSTANSKSSHTKPLQQEPSLTPPTPSGGVDIVKTKRRTSHVQSSQRDPRTLFGSGEAYSPWIRKLSPNRFEQDVPPSMVSPGSPPPKSIWETTDEEFDRWPTPAQARSELETVRLNATSHRNTFVKPDLSIAQQLADAIETPLGASATTEEQEQLILELQDMACGNPWGRDAHDEVIKRFYSHAYPSLPATAPPRRPHVLNAQAYTSATSPVAKAARPRLCDAVATVLAYTSPECVAAFLDPEVEVFEWRRLGNCVMIRREGNQVAVGNYYNFGTMYQWGYFVRSSIDRDGVWSETWASVGQGSTPVGKEGVLFEDFEVENTDGGVEGGILADDEDFALFMGRELAAFLLTWEVWNYNKWWRYKVEWEADGKVTNAREVNRYPAGLTFD